MTHTTETSRTRDGGKRSLWLILGILAIVAIAALAMFMSNNGRGEGEAVEGAVTGVTTDINAAPVAGAARDTASAAGNGVENAAADATDGDPDSNNNEPAR
jgi:flagellar basal body-associated protein FliL